MDTSCRKLKSQITQSIVLLLTVMAIVGTVFCADALAGTGHEEESLEADMSATKAGVMKYALIAAAVAFGLGAIGAGIAISHVGAAAMGAVAEKPEVGSQALLFIALAEGLVVFGFITSILILNKV
jgi:V/A-type H+-transporting ATPase subunit K